MKFAAIDIGSNAVRLLLTQVLENGDKPYFKKDSLIRIPLRLGEDAFVRRRISDEKGEQLVKTMTGFRALIDAYRALDYMACATSAMREASNGQSLVEEVRRRSKVDLQIVDGGMEAELLYANRFEEQLERDKAYLYIDVGGGSTELTLLYHKKSVASRSFNIGTVRSLQNLVPRQSWDEMRAWLKQHTREPVPVAAIGSGGNINKIFKLARLKEGKPLSLKKIKQIFQHLSSYTYYDRITKLGLRPDRADVIIPASEIYLSVMKWAKIKKIYVPQIGISDGMIHVLYDRYKQRMETE